MGLANWLTVLRILLIPVFVSLLVYRQRGLALGVFLDVLEGESQGPLTDLVRVAGYTGQQQARRTSPGQQGFHQFSHVTLRSLLFLKVEPASTGVIR